MPVMSGEEALERSRRSDRTSGCRFQRLQRGRSHPALHRNRRCRFHSEAIPIGAACEKIKAVLEGRAAGNRRTFALPRPAIPVGAALRIAAGNSGRPPNSAAAPRRATPPRFNTSITISMTSASAARRFLPDRLRADLKKLAIAPLLRTLAPEHGPHVVQLLHSRTWSSRCSIYARITEAVFSGRSVRDVSSRSWKVYISLVTMLDPRLRRVRTTASLRGWSPASRDSYSCGKLRARWLPRGSTPRWMEVVSPWFL